MRTMNTLPLGIVIGSEVDVKHIASEPLFLTWTNRTHLSGQLSSQVGKEHHVTRSTNSPTPPKQPHCSFMILMKFLIYPLLPACKPIKVK